MTVLFIQMAIDAQCNASYASCVFAVSSRGYDTTASDVVLEKRYMQLDIVI